MRYKSQAKILFMLCAMWVALVSAANTAQACSCISPPPIDIAFEGTPTVVALKLQSVEKYAKGEQGYGYGGIKQSKLTVEQVFKGDLTLGEELTFAQGAGGDCIWTFSEENVGTEYLFYLYETPGKQDLWAGSICSRSRRMKYAAADLLYLEKFAKVRGKTRLSGTLIQKISSAVEGESYSYNRLAGRKVRISGNGKNIEVKTDENGVYEIYDLPVGKYRVTPENIDGYKLRQNAENFVEVEITAKRHTEQNFDFEIDNVISGKVFDTNGKPLNRVCLHLLPARGKKSQYFYHGDCTENDGAFKFDEIPAGTYLIVINDDGEISADEPFGTFYYPSAVRREEAAEITIGAGDAIKDLIVIAPQMVETVTFTGILLFEDGKPVADEFIEFYADKDAATPQDKYEKADARAKSDVNGRFSIRILKGQKGKLFGSMYSFEGEYENCPKHDKLMRAANKTEQSSNYIFTPKLSLEAVADASGIELRFPFPGCKKAKIGQ